MIYIDKYINVILSALLAVAAYAFWAFVHPEALVYQEQLQMFLFDQEYLQERVLAPAGVSRYIAEFLVQFYYEIYIGAGVLAMLYIIVQQLVWQITKDHCRNKQIGFLLSFLPVLLLWYSMGDENIKLTSVIALIFALMAIWAYPIGKSFVCRSIYAIIIIPAVYFLAGPMVLLVLAHCIWMEIAYNKSVKILVPFAVSYVAIVMITLLYVQHPFVRAMIYGINFSLLADQIPWMLYAVMFLCSLVPFVSKFFAEFKTEKKRNITIGAFTVFIFVVSLLIVPLNFDSKKYDVFEYDYLMRGMKWQQIINKAEKTEANSPLSVATYNLALGMTGQMDCAMQFRQGGWAGAFPPFTMTYISSLMTNEIYWQLGLVNTSQRFMFEAMEVIPDNNKSARIIRRLAETNLVNGQYLVARKYLLLLQKTMFYRTWATETMELLGKEDAINSHPLYGYLRRCRLTNDFLFSEPEIDKIMGQLVMRNSENYLAMQYLLFLPQLEGNQQKYLIYRNFVDETLKKQKNQ